MMGSYRLSSVCSRVMFFCLVLGFLCGHCGATRGDLGSRGDDFVCPSGWEALHRACYRFKTQPASSWNEAKSDCERDGAQLLSVGDVSKKNQIRKRLRQLDEGIHRTWWVGLHKNRSQWIWLDGQPANFRITPWVPGEPNNQGRNGENCGEMNDKGDVNDKECNAIRPFVCEKPSDPVVQSNDIKCGQTDMSFSIPTSAINFVPKNVTLSDPRCHVNITVNRLTGKTPLNACGTTLRVTSDNLIFSNFLLLPPRRPSNNNNNNNKNITSNIEHIIPIECHYKRVSDLRLSYLPMVRQILFTETGVGQFQFRIEQFREGSYSSRIPDAEYPLEVTSSKRVYLQLSLGEWVQQGEGGYGMEVERCVASPSPSMMAFHNDSSKDLIRHGCPVKQDVQLSPVASQSENANRNLSGPHEHFRFSFKPTIVSDPSDPRKALPMRLLYIHCRVRLCAQDSCPSPADCAKPASSGGNNVARRKRAIREEGYGAGLYAGHNLATGPFVLTQDDKDAPRSPALISPLVVALAALAGTTTLIALGVIVAWTFSRRRGWRSERYEVNGVIAASRQ